MILVTGASGTVGTALIEALGDRPGVLRATRKRQAPDADARWFDFADPASYAPALAGVERLFLLLPPGLADARARFAAVLDAARASGTRHAVFLSIRNADRLPMLPHRGLEKVIEASGLAWTHIRPNDWMQNFATQPVLRDGIAAGELWAASGRSRTSYVDVRDVGEAGARVLTGDGHGSRAYSLTGPQELSLDEVATVFGEVLGRPVRYVRPSLFGFFRHARRAGAPAPLAAIMTSIGVVARLGYAGGVDPDLFRLLGRTPRSFTQFARDHRTVWSG